MTRKYARTGCMVIVCYSILAFFAQFASAQRIVADSLLKKLPYVKADTARIDMLNSIAFNLRLVDSARAQQYRRQALALSNKINYDKGKAWALYLEGVLFTYQNKYVHSMASEIKAIAIGQKIKNYEIIARGYNSIGVNNLRLEDDYNAMKAFQTALLAIKKSPDNTFEAALIFNIGTLYSKKKRYKEALDNFDRAIEMNIKANKKTALSLCYLESGMAYLAMKEFEKAEYFGLKSLDLANETEYTQTEINSRVLLAGVDMEFGRLTRARNYLDTALQKANERNFNREKLRVYQAYYTLFEKQGNYKSAYQNSLIYNKLYDSLYNNNRSKLIMEYQEKFQTQQTEAENKLLRSEQSKNELQIRQNSKLLYGSYIVLGALAIFSFVIYGGFKRIKVANSELIRQKNQIGAQKENLENLNTIKDKLFSVIAHDLRSPFISLKQMIDLYEEGMISKDDFDYFFKVIRKDVGNSSLLIDNLLIWAKSQLDGFKSQPVPLNLGHLANEVLFYFKKTLSDKQLRVNNKINLGINVHADREMTIAVMRNIIGNAIKFTPKKGLIEISARACDGNIQVSISDSGIGIAPEDQSKLFEDTFFTTPGLNKEKGTGLGLQICKEFVEKNNGSIWLESDSGNGATIFFTLPESTEKAEYLPGPSEADMAEKNQLKEAVQSSIKLQHKYDRYELLAKATNDVIWDMDCLTNEISWNESLFVDFGYPDEKTTLEWWIALVHPDDHPRVESTWNRSIEEKEANWECEYRFKASDGTYKAVFDRAHFLYDDHGNVFRAVGILQNIQAQKNAIRDMQRLSLVATLVNNLVLITDENDQIIWVNQAFETLTGFALPEILGRVPKDFLAGDGTDSRTLREMDQSIADHTGITAEILNYTKSGTPYWVQVDCTAFHDPITNQKGYISVQTLITDRKRSERVILRKNKILREIAHISSHDLRNPISSILGLSKLLQDNPSEREREECIAMIDRSAKKLDSLIYKIHNQINEIEEQEV